VKVKKALFILGLIVVWVFSFHAVDLARAKDPDYPTRQINLVIPMGAGGTTDISSRAFAEVTTKYIGQPMIPVNKPGAGVRSGQRW